MAIRHVIFDWDGTLVQTLDLWLIAYQDAFEARGHYYTAKEIVSEFFTNHDTIPARHPHLNFPPIAEQAFTYVQNNAHKSTLYAGAGAIATQVAEAGCTVSLVSSSGRYVLEKGLNAHRLGADFGSIIAGDDGFGHKPSTTPFEETLRRQGHAAEETLIIGDSLVDIQAGQALGCQTCFFAPASNERFHNFAQLAALGPDHQIDHLNGLLGLVKTPALAR